MRKRLFVPLLILLAIPVFAQTVAIRAGFVIDPAKGTVAKDQVILVEQGKIKSMGAGIAIPPGAPTVDLSKEWIMPGLMDAHTHLTLTEILNAPFESFYLKESTAFRALRGLRNAQVLLQRGFTAVREVGNDGDYATEDVRKAIQQGLFDGPTILSAGKIITPFGGQSYAVPQEQGPFWLYEYIDADSPEEMRKAVRKNIYYGADLIKLVTDNGAYHFSLDEIRAIAAQFCRSWGCRSHTAVTPSITGVPPAALTATRPRASGPRAAPRRSAPSSPAAAGRGSAPAPSRQGCGSGPCSARLMHRPIMNVRISSTSRSTTRSMLYLRPSASSLARSFPLMRVKRSAGVGVCVSISARNIGSNCDLDKEKIYH